MPSLSKPGIVNPIQQTTGVLVKKIRVDYVSLHIARLPLGSFRCRAAISCLKQYIQGLQSNADYGNKHLASVLAFERLNFRETYAPDEGGNEVITNSGDHQAAAKPASSIDYRKGNQTQDNILVKSHIVYRLCNHMVYTLSLIQPGVIVQEIALFECVNSLVQVDAADSELSEHQCDLPREC